MGQQSRTYQTWTIVGFLLLHHFLRVNPDDVEMLDLDGLPALEQQLKNAAIKNPQRRAGVFYS